MSEFVMVYVDDEVAIFCADNGEGHYVAKRIYAKTNTIKYSVYYNGRLVMEWEQSA